MVKPVSKWSVKREEVVACVVALLVGLFAAAVVHLVFGEEFATRQQARMYAPIVGQFYGEGQRDQVRALLIDDASLEEAGQVWPARYAYSARLLAALAHYRPKAVFVDIYYQAQRDDASIGRLVNQLCAMQEQGIPVKLAAVRDASGAYRLRPELEAVAGRCFEKVSVRYQPDEIDHLAWNYVLEADGGPGQPPLRSAALALAASGGAELPHGHHPMSVTWGLRPARSGLAWHDGGPAQRAYCRPDHGVFELLPMGVREWMYHDTQQPVCIFHDTLRASELSQTSASDEARLRHELEGKYVVLGLATSGSGDMVYSPIHGRIPGLYLHAMALDNILTFGAHAPQDVHLIGAGSASAWIFQLAALSVLIICLRALKHPAKAWLNTYYYEKINECHRFKVGEFAPLTGIGFLLLCVVQLLLSLVLGCAMLWLGQKVFHIGFLSLIGIVFVTLVAEWTEFNEHLLERVYPPAAKEPSHPKN
ncbi:MAG: CHASE2 domain-containing protein [Sphingomonadaceae bacterium]